MDSKTLQASIRKAKGNMVSSHKYLVRSHYNGRTLVWQWDDKGLVSVPCEWNGCAFESVQTGEIVSQYSSATWNRMLKNGEWNQNETILNNHEERDARDKTGCLQFTIVG